MHVFKKKTYANCQKDIYRTMSICSELMRKRRSERQRREEISKRVENKAKQSDRGRKECWRDRDVEEGG